MYRTCIFRLLVAIFTFGAMFFTGNTIFANSIVYDNTITSTGIVYFNTSIEYGDEITLGGSERTITDFEFYYSKYNEADDPTARIRFYNNNGQSGAPSTLFYDSGNFALPVGVGDFTYSLSGLSVLVPDTFIWTVAWESTLFECYGWCMVEPYHIQLSTYNPPTVGFSDKDYWSLDYYSSSWVKESGDVIYPFNFGATITATTVPEPSTFLLLCIGIAGIIFVRWRFIRKAKSV